ncbi:MAG: hypothetical protein AAB400_00095 [Patescibacteria group bacterium]
MSVQEKVSLILRIGIFGEFLGHGALALGMKKEWVGWIVQLFALPSELAANIVFVIGILDILVALTVLFCPQRWVLVWAAFWGFATALVRPIVGQPMWDFIERWANWAAPLALWYLLQSNEKCQKTTEKINPERTITELESRDLN